jgi:hypothetical protein
MRRYGDGSPTFSAKYSLLAATICFERITLDQRAECIRLRPPTPTSALSLQVGLSLSTSDDPEVRPARLRGDQPRQ